MADAATAPSRADPDEDVDLDFDATLVDRPKVGPRIRVYGVVYQLPRVMPALTILLARRLTRAKGKATDADLDDLIQLLESVFGEGNVERILSSGIGFDELTDLMMAVQKVYGGRGQKNGPVPAGKEG